MPRTAAPRTPATPEKKAPAVKAAGTRSPRKSTSRADGTAKAPAKTTARKTAAAETGKATKKATTAAARTKATQPRAKADGTAKAPAKTASGAARTRGAAKKATAWPEFITHKMIHAHYQARLHRLPTRNIRDWRELADGTTVLHFPSGARLDYTPDQDAPFHANTPCPGGNIHRQPVRTPADLADAEKAAKDCTDHTGAAAPANIAITRVLPAPEPAENTDAPEPQARETGGRRTIPAWAKQIPGAEPITETIPIAEEPVAKATASAADTQSMSLDEIHRDLITRAADALDLDATAILQVIIPKEHPEP